MRDFSSTEILTKDGRIYISTIYKGSQSLEERISEIDNTRLQQEEISIDDLVYKYFAYLSE